MDRILITGGTGKLGSDIARVLQDKPYALSILTTQNNYTGNDKISYIKGDLTQIDTLEQLRSQFDVIIHCASNSKDSYSVDIEGTHNLLMAIGPKIKHFIYISIVGVDKGISPYYQNKYSVEQEIFNYHIPFTIVRATQFHDLVLDRIIRPNEEHAKIKVPKGLKFQTIDVSDVALKVEEVLKEGPKQSVVNIGGPELLSLEEMIEPYIKIFHPEKTLENINDLNDFQKIFTTGINLCPESKYGKITWKEFLLTRYEKL